MTRKLALKRLTASDLTFFEWHFTHRNAGNQKAINLNADVLVTRLYPGLPGVADQTNGRIPLSLTIYGPASAGEHNIQRKIIKGQTYKNWRLDGEFVSNPLEEPERFNILQPQDIALFLFSGEPSPSSVKLLLVASNHPADQLLHASLSQFMADNSMVEITQAQLRQLAEASTPEESHPVYLFILHDTLEDAAQGGIQGIDLLLKRRLHAQVTHEDLASARSNANRVGREGEAIVNSYLEVLRTEGHLSAVDWVSEVNAISPFDFSVRLPDGQRILIEVKSTESSFENPIHISLSEFRQIAGGPSPYHVYRVYDLDARSGTATVRICKDLSAPAAKVMAAAASLSPHIHPDAFSISTESLPFGDPIDLSMPEAPPD